MMPRSMDSKMVFRKLLVYCLAMEGGAVRSAIISIIPTTLIKTTTVRAIYLPIPVVYGALRLDQRNMIPKNPVIATKKDAGIIALSYIRRLFSCRYWLSNS
jgi:hypothetical protein